MFRGQEYAAPYGLYRRGDFSEKELHAPAGRTRKPAISGRWLCQAVAPLDVVLIFAMSVAAYGIALWDDPSSTFANYLTTSALGTVLTVNTFNLLGLYSKQTLLQPAASLRRLIGGWGGVAAVMLAIGMLSQLSGNYSGVWALTWFGLGLTALLGSRLALFALASRLAAEERLGETVAIIGEASLTRILARHFSDNPDHGVHVTGLYEDSFHAGRSSVGRRASGMEGTEEDLIARLREEPVDSVILALPDNNEERFRHLRQRLTEVPVDVRLCPSQRAVTSAMSGVSEFAGVPTLNLADRPLAGWRAVLKETEDRIGGGLICLMISPILLGIAVAIKLDSPGPVFFRQKRIGYNNQLIDVLKFRTMYVDQSDENADQLTQKNDPRVTPLGAFLRRWSLDELPQFLNVLRGDMSIVGPRPHALHAKAAGQLYQKVVPNYDARHRVKPGITGLAQIRGWRGPTDTRRQILKRVEHDILYVENWSLWLDLKIILLTAFTGFRSENAY